MNKKAAIFYFLMLVAVTTLIKILCAPNIEFSGFTAVMAVALFAGLTSSSAKNAFLLPLIVLFISNIILEVLFRLNLFVFHGFYKWQILEYSLILVLALIGMLLRKSRTAGVFIAAFAGPTLYFIVSNFFVWLISWQTLGYTHDIKGLTTCYTAGLPFYRNSIISTVVFLPVFIMAYNWIVKGKAALTLAK